MRRVHLPSFAERVQMLFDRVRRPVLHGEIASELGCSLAQVEFDLAPYISSGEVRQLKSEELRAISLDTRFLVYALETKIFSAH